MINISPYCTVSTLNATFLAGVYLAGLFALHDFEDGVFERVVDEGCCCGLHVLLHQCAGQCSRSEQCCGLIW